ncbi:reverse transcriptase domain-containing protein, partial [Tanacetum coccineum]
MRGLCSMHAGPRSVVAKPLRSGYYWLTMHADAKKLIRERNSCQVHRPVLKNPQQNLTLITSPWPFYKWGIDIAGPFPEGPGKVKFLIVAMDYFTKWIVEKPVATITWAQIKKFINYGVLGISIRRIQDLLYTKLLEEIKRGPYSKKSQYAVSYIGGYVTLDDPNITIEEYIRLEEEKAHRCGKVFNWETATYDIVFNDTLTSKAALSCEPTVSSLNDEFDFRILFDESDDEDCT